MNMLMPNAPRLSQAVAPIGPVAPVAPIISAGPAVVGNGAYNWTPILLGGAVLAGVFLLATALAKD